jgi:hypothetical protein
MKTGSFAALEGPRSATPQQQSTSRTPTRRIEVLTEWLNRQNANSVKAGPTAKRTTRQLVNFRNHVYSLERQIEQQGWQDLDDHRYKALLDQNPWVAEDASFKAITAEYHNALPAQQSQEGTFSSLTVNCKLSISPVERLSL